MQTKHTAMHLIHTSCTPIAHPYPNLAPTILPCPGDPWIHSWDSPERAPIRTLYWDLSRVIKKFLNATPHAIRAERPDFATILSLPHISPSMHLLSLLLGNTSCIKPLQFGACNLRSFFRWYLPCVGKYITPRQTT